ncbi:MULTISPECIES: two-component system sensor histidine kinase CseC [unclassified Streptomyces]|uniref:two-component system sensor histidine kinase CseC n=1 Tax=unclassified Streptomyces TaxID=2593676 RepID=UPI0030D44D7F
MFGRPAPGTPAAAGRVRIPGGRGAAGDGVRTGTRENVGTGAGGGAGRSEVLGGGGGPGEAGGRGRGIGIGIDRGTDSGTSIRTGIRWKLSTAIALVGALVAVALSLVVHNAARVSMLDNSRDLADERIQLAERMYGPGRPPPFGAKIDDPSIPSDLMVKVAEGRRATYVSDSPNGVPDIWAAVPLRNGQVLSWHERFTDRNADVMKDLDQALIIGSIAVVFGGSALGVLIGGQLSRRLRKAAAAANRVAKGETDVRVRDAIGGVVLDETDDLARAVDAMADALQQRIEAERRVTADIAHELRTPVTGLLTAAELLPPGRPTELVRDRAQAMRTLVEDVLEVARLDGASERAELQDIMLGEFVARRIAARGADVEVRVVHESEVTTDPRRLERVLLNLLANAARHGRPPIEVTVEGRVIRVRDHGPGFPETLLAEGPSRFRTGSTDRAGDGHGLGLTIAAGQARVLGARLTFRNVRPAGAPAGVPAEGAVAVLWLPEHAPTNTGSFPILPASGK